MERTGSLPFGIEEILSDRVLGRSLDCPCGRDHRILTRKVVIEPGVADRVPEMLPALIPGERILLLADRRTWKAAGERLSEALGTSYSVECCMLRDDPTGHIHASVEMVDELMAACTGVFDMVAAVGSGTINDLGKEIAHRRGIPCFVLATAASMNGYTSAIVALLENGLKTTRPTTPPVAVFADPNVLGKAPRELTLAGLGDLVSKPYCGCDWKIASLVRGEYHCPLPDRLLSGPFEEALEAFPRLAEDDPEAVILLFRLLLISTSSPASGGEHLLSHYWDMTRLRDGRPLNLHGAQVGVASLVIDDLYRRIVELDFGGVRCAPNPSPDDALRDVMEIFGALAPAVWPQWQAKLEARTADDLERLVGNEAAIKEEIERTLAVGRKVRHALTASGAPIEAAKLGISAEELEAAIRNGRKIRTRYTVLDVAAELEVLDAFADLAGRGGATH
jgi:glycerol-1-phosphate dehydrogenase [NAD(P)+]